MLVSLLVLAVLLVWGVLKKACKSKR